MAQIPWTPRRGWRWFFLRWLVLLLLLFLGIAYMTAMPGRSYEGSFPPLSSDEKRLRDRLEQHVWHLASAIGERNVWHPEQLESAAEYIVEELERMGYGVESQVLRSGGMSVRNLVAELPGATRGTEIVLLGAHYDSVLGSPGANDNASGVAALLELARSMRAERFARTVRFVAFVNEEPPFFQTDFMGSRAYAKRVRARGDNIVAMLSLETIGYYTDEPRSQQYPFPFGLLYPDRGNFIGFVGNLSSRSLVRRAVEAFRETTRFPSEGVAAPGWVMGVDWSDHASFWDEGFPAIMLTDTALFRYRDYHAPTDMPDRLDYEAFTHVVAGIGRVVRELADG